MSSPTPTSIHLYSRHRFGLRQVRAFVCLANELHFGRTASHLFTSQPALSRMIHGLEDALGVQLLTRSTRKVVLTAAGEAFASECTLALAHLELATQAARATITENRGCLRMAYTDFATEGRLPLILEKFHETDSRVSVILEYMPTAAQHVSLLGGRIDVGFTTGELRAPNIHNVLLEEHEFVALLPEAHKLAGREGIRLTELAQENFVIGAEATFSSFRRLVFDLCHTAGFYPRVVQEVATSNGIFGLVAAGMGVTIYSASIRSLRRSGVVVKRLSDVSCKIPIFASYLADHRSDELRRFLSLVIDTKWPVVW